MSSTINGFRKKRAIKSSQITAVPILTNYTFKQKFYLFLRQIPARIKRQKQDLLKRLSSLLVVFISLRNKKALKKTPIETALKNDSIPRFQSLNKFLKLPK